MEHKYQPGERVVLTEDHPDCNEILISGHVGTVIKYTSGMSVCGDHGGRVGVEWDIAGYFGPEHSYRHFHDLDGDLDHDSGWYVYEDSIEPYIDFDPVEESLDMSDLLS